MGSTLKGTPTVEEGDPAPPPRRARMPTTELDGGSGADDLDARSTFDNFLVVDGNRQAFEICRQVAQAEPSRTALTYIWGAPGSGKHHLFEATARRRLEQEPEKTILAVSLDELTAAGVHLLPVLEGPSGPGMVLIEQFDHFYLNPGFAQTAPAMLASLKSRGTDVILFGTRPLAEIEAPPSSLAVLDGVLQVQTAPPSDDEYHVFFADLLHRRKLDLSPGTMKLVASRVRAPYDLRRFVEALVNLQRYTDGKVESHEVNRILVDLGLLAAGRDLVPPPPVQLPPRNLPYRILVVEDRFKPRQHICSLLKAAGFEVGEASEGEAGLDQLTSGRFDLAIIDGRMPGMDGIDLVKSARAKRVKIPLLLLTSPRSPRVAEKALEAGANDYIIKPATDSILLNTVRYYLAARRPHRISEEEMDTIPTVEPGSTTIFSGDADLALELALRARKHGPVSLVSPIVPEHVAGRLTTEGGPPLAAHWITNIRHPRGIHAGDLGKVARALMELVIDPTTEYLIVGGLEYLSIYHRRGNLIRLLDRLSQQVARRALRLIVVVPLSWDLKGPIMDTTPEQTLESAPSVDDGVFQALSFAELQTRSGLPVAGDEGLPTANAVYVPDAVSLVELVRNWKILAQGEVVLPRSLQARVANLTSMTFHPLVLSPELETVAMTTAEHWGLGIEVGRNLALSGALGYPYATGEPMALIMDDRTLGANLVPAMEPSPLIVDLALLLEMVLEGWLDDLTDHWLYVTPDALEVILFLKESTTPVGLEGPGDLPVLRPSIRGVVDHDYIRIFGDTLASLHNSLDQFYTPAPAPEGSPSWIIPVELEEDDRALTRRVLEIANISKTSAQALAIAQRLDVLFHFTAEPEERPAEDRADPVVETEEE